MEILNFQDKRWLVKYKADDNGYSSARIEWTKLYRETDLLLKKNGVLFFVQEILEIDFEDIPKEK